MTTAVTTTVRVIGCVHHDTTNSRADTLATTATSGTNFNVLVLEVSDGSNASFSSLEDFTNFAGRHAEGCVAVFASHELGAGAGGANHLGATTWG